MNQPMSQLPQTQGLEMINISDEQDSGRDLREFEDKYQTLVEQSLQGLAVMQDGGFVFCNNKFAEITGYSLEELLSISPDQMTAMIHPDDRDFIKDRYHARIEGRPAPSRYEYRGIKKDGTEIWLEIFSTAITYKGRPAIQAAFMDITDHKRALEDLQKALKWQEAIFEGSRDAVMISNRDSKFIAANERACQLTGYSKEELLNMGAWDLNKDTDPALLDSLRERIFAGEDILGDTKIYTKDGREIDVEFGHRRVIISGEFYIHSIVRDITNQKRLEAQFQQAQKMEAIGILAGGVAHDFNNLLNVINGYSELLLEDLAADSPMRKDLEEVRKAGQKAASLTSQLLAFSRKQVLQPQIMNLNETVAEMSAMLKRLIGEDIELAATTHPNLDLINADPGQIQQIIMNLAVNARDAMPQGGKLTIEISNAEFDEDYVRGHPQVKAGSYVMLAISDNGAGMDPVTQAHIFEPFFTTKGRGKGTGLGLSTVYGIVKQSNGFIWVYSETGRGTTFKIYFPRAEQKTTPAAAESKPEHGSRGSETVLVAEDEEAVRALACRILRGGGYEVLEAADGIEAVRISEEHSGEIKLVLTDVIMPGMGGKDLIARLRTARPNIKALYVSGYTDNSIVHHGMLESGVAFLQKPFTSDRLARKIREVLDS
jgi:two-component system cell cycle sensor histidine kinase/response regulator CckA